MVLLAWSGNWSPYENGIGTVVARPRHICFALSCCAFRPVVVPHVAAHHRRVRVGLRHPFVARSALRFVIRIPPKQSPAVLERQNLLVQEAVGRQPLHTVHGLVELGRRRCLRRAVAREVKDSASLVLVEHSLDFADARAERARRVLSSVAASLDVVGEARCRCVGGIGPDDAETERAVEETAPAPGIRVSPRTSASERNRRSGRLLFEARPHDHRRQRLRRRALEMPAAFDVVVPRRVPPRT